MTTLQSLFPELVPQPPYRHYSEQEIEAIWKNAVFSPDANVLLRLYELSDTASEALRTILKELAVAKQLVITHQAAKEFMTRRVDAIKNQARVYRKEADGMMDIIEQRIRTPLHVDKLRQLASNETVRAAETSITAIQDDLRKKAIKVEEQIDVNNDSIVSFINMELHEAILPMLDDESLRKAKEEAKRRIKEKIPPGYEDGKDGDYLIWTQLIQYAKAKSSNIIIITEETTGDWWSNIKERIHPRLEMIQEFEQQAMHKCHLSSIETFLKQKGATAEVIEEVVAGGEDYPDGTKPIEMMNLREKDGISKIHDRIMRGNTDIRNKLDLYRSSGEAESRFNIPLMLEEAVKAVHRTVRHLNKQIYVHTDQRYIHLDRGQILLNRILRFRDKTFTTESYAGLKSIVAVL